MRGTLLNTATVAAGACVGLAAGKFIPDSYQGVVMTGLGLVTCLIGVRLFLQSKNVLVVVGAVALGGILGHLLGVQYGLESFADWTKHLFGGGGRFNEAVITTSVLYCVGPMTLLGCLQDGLEGKIELLAIKSVMDGIGAIFFAAAMGPGVLVTAVVVLVFQGTLTLLAKPLQGVLKDEQMIAETSAVGGALLLAIGLGLLEIKKIPVATYLPSLLLAPLFARLDAVMTSRKASSD